MLSRLTGSELFKITTSSLFIVPHKLNVSQAGAIKRDRRPLLACWLCGALWRSPRGLSSAQVGVFADRLFSLVTEGSSHVGEELCDTNRLDCMATQLPRVRSFRQLQLSTYVAEQETMLPVANCGRISQSAKSHSHRKRHGTHEDWMRRVILSDVAR